MLIALVFSKFNFVSATSTPVEHLFSHGGMQFTKWCHSLPFATLCCLMVLRSWFMEGLVPESKVMEMFRELKNRRAEDNI